MVNSTLYFITNFKGNIFMVFQKTNLFCRNPVLAIIFLNYLFEIPQFEKQTNSHLYLVTSLLKNHFFLFFQNTSGLSIRNLKDTMSYFYQMIDGNFLLWFILLTARFNNLSFLAWFFKKIFFQFIWILIYILCHQTSHGST